MTFNITTPGGEVKIVAPFKIGRKGKEKLKKVFTTIATGNEPLPDENMEAFLKRLDPEVDTPIGTIKGLLTLYGWSQKDLSKKSRLSVSVICDILKGRRSVGVATAKKLGKALKKDYRVFL